MKKEFCRKLVDFYKSERTELKMSIRQALTSSTAAYIAGNKYSVENLGQSVESDIPLVDARLHLKDGTLLSNSGIYKDFVEYMENLSISDPNADNFCTEQEWQSSVSTYGCCGSYVVDTTNHTVRLPKTNLENGRYLVKAYKNGSTCYNIYSDGWCEQAFKTNAVAAVNGTVPLPIAFKDTNYTVTAGVADYADAYPTCFSVAPATPSTIYAIAGYNGTLYTNEITVYACGYVDIPESVVGKKYSYVCVATSVKQPAVVEIDNVVTDLNGKADVDLSNCTKPHIVETYVNGTSGYRVWSDGYCEQWGYVPTQTRNDYIPITLLKPYINTDYTMDISSRVVRYLELSVAAFSLLTTNKTVSGFTVAADLNVEVYWKTEGYIN